VGLVDPLLEQVRGQRHRLVQGGRVDEVRGDHVVALLGAQRQFAAGDGLADHGPAELGGE
jgi:hypothetical protein